MRWMSSRRVEDPELGATAILKRQAPAWWWLRKNFTLPAVLAISGLVAGAGSWLWAQHTAIRDLRRAIADLEDPRPRFDKIEARINAIELDQAGEKRDLADFSRRVGAQEAEWDRVHDAARQRVRSRY